MKLMRVLMLLFFSSAFLFSSPTKVEIANMKKIVGYFPNWGVYGIHRQYFPDKIPFDKLTHIQVAFMGLYKEGTGYALKSPDAPADFTKSFGEAWNSEFKGNYGQLRKLRVKYPHISILPSIGGWTLSGYFSEIMKLAVNGDTTHLDKFVSESVEFMTKYELDGLDIDWEFPGSARKPDKVDNINDQGNPANSTDSDGYTLMMKSLREALDAQGATDGRYYQLTSAIGSSQVHMAGVDATKYAEYLDMINVMSYDMHGAWDGTTNHQSPTYQHDGLKDDNLTIEDAVRRLKASGVPSNKIIIGTPFYTRGWKGVDCSNLTTPLKDSQGNDLPGLGCKASGGAAGNWDGGRAAGVNPYYEIINGKVGRANISSFTKYYDDKSNAPYLYSTSIKEFYTYEDTVSLKKKLDFVLNKDGSKNPANEELGGIIIWELSEDMRADLGENINDSLINLIYNSFYGTSSGPVIADKTTKTIDPAKSKTMNQEQTEKTNETKIGDSKNKSAAFIEGGDVCSIGGGRTHYNKDEVAIIGDHKCTAKWWINVCDANNGAWKCDTSTQAITSTKTISSTDKNSSEDEANKIAKALKENKDINTIDVNKSAKLANTEANTSSNAKVDDNIVNPTPPTASQLAIQQKEANKCHKDQVYKGGDKCEYNGNWYEFSWWTKPTSSDVSALGGVKLLQGDVDVPTIQVIASNGLPVWQFSQVYAKAGTNVIHQGNVYASKWWTSGNEPIPFVGNTPWKYLGVADNTQTGDKGTTTTTTAQVKNVTLTEDDDTVSSADGTTATFDKEKNTTIISDMTPAVIPPVSPKPSTSTFFMPFIDASSWPPYDPQVAIDEGIKNFAISFVNSSGGSCSPTWGNYKAYPIDNATLNIPNKIKNITANGGSTMISFGGAIAHGDELPKVCVNKVKLAEAYQKVIDLTGVKMIDFDIEGGNSYDKIAVTRRMDALAIIQANNPNIEISFTLAVMPYGLLADSGLMILKTAIAKGIKFKLVNLMLMDYGTSYPANVEGAYKMSAYSIQALSSVNAQLKTILAGKEADYPKDTNGEYYNMLGATPMIGRNDTLVEYFYKEDVTALVKFCNEKGVRMTSMWSLNRDKPIASGEPAGALLYKSTKLNSTQYGSGKLEFSKILNNRGL